MTISELKESGEYENVVIFDNPSYEDAFIGLSHDDRAVYDYEKMVEWLVAKDEMSYEEAAEFIDYNTIRSLPYVQDSPIIVFTAV